MGALDVLRGIADDDGQGRGDRFAVDQGTRRRAVLVSSPRSVESGPCPPKEKKRFSLEA